MLDCVPEAVGASGAGANRQVPEGNPKKCQTWGSGHVVVWATLKKKVYLDEVQWLAFSKRQGILDLIPRKPSAAGLIPLAALANPSHWEIDVIFGEGWKCPTYTVNIIALKTIQWNLSGGPVLSATVVGLRWGAYSLRPPAMFCVDVIVSVGPCKCIWRRNACGLTFP